jgi:hypothetical protein
MSTSLLSPLAPPGGLCEGEAQPTIAACLLVKDGFADGIERCIASVFDRERFRFREVLPIPGVWECPRR